VKVVLSQLPPIQGGTPDATDTSLNSKVAAYVDNTSGLHLDELTPDMRNWLGYDDDMQGVVVSEVVKHTPGYNEGICAGMVVLSVAGRATSTLEEYKAAVGRLQTTANTLVLVGTPEGNRYVVMKPSKDQTPQSGR
jgi:S1-C subfamily serine protease